MKKILIIDDERRITEIYLKMFVSAGFIVRIANDAQVATNILIREEIDLIVLDIRMPTVDGKETMDIIREYNPLAKVVISSVFPVDKQQKMVPSALFYYDKSEGPLKLLENVQHILN